MIVQYSVFGSILTIGAIVGAVVSGKLADYIGRRGVSFFVPFFPPKIIFGNFELSINFFDLFPLFSEQTMGFAEIFCLLGWLLIAFSKVSLNLLSYD